MSVCVDTEEASDAGWVTETLKKRPSLSMDSPDKKDLAASIFKVELLFRWKIGEQVVRPPIYWLVDLITWSEWSGLSIQLVGWFHCLSRSVWLADSFGWLIRLLG